MFEMQATHVLQTSFFWGGGVVVKSKICQILMRTIYQITILFSPFNRPKIDFTVAVWLSSN